MKTLLLFMATALAEIVGCYMPWRWLRKGGSLWLLLPAAACPALFAWLLTLHPMASGRVMPLTVAYTWPWRSAGCGGSMG